MIYYYYRCGNVEKVFFISILHMNSHVSTKIHKIKNAVFLNYGGFKGYYSQTRITKLYYFT